MRLTDTACAAIVAASTCCTGSLLTYWQMRPSQKRRWKQPLQSGTARDLKGLYTPQKAGSRRGGNRRCHIRARSRRGIAHTAFAARRRGRRRLLPPCFGSSAATSEKWPTSCARQWAEPLRRHGTTRPAQPCSNLATTLRQQHGRGSSIPS